MMANTIPRRHVLLQALAGVVLVSTSRFSLGLTTNAASQEKAGPGRANGESDKDTGKEKGEQGAAKSKSTVLIVVVTGKGKPIPQAEVKAKFQGGEERLPTNQEGEASFRFSSAGTAEVRVIVAGWESVLTEVVLKGGPQRLPIELKPLPDVK